MTLIVLGFLISFICSLLIVCTNSFHIKVSSGDFHFEPQKIHSSSTPRIGGISIFLALLIVGPLATNLNLTKSATLLNVLPLFALPVFIIGLIEDLTKKIKPKTRLLVIFLSSAVCNQMLNLSIINTDIYFIDYLLGFFGFSFLFTVVAICGLTNSFNIIDGLNGLASMVSMLALLAISYVSFLENDVEIFFISLIFLSAIFGFFLINYPRGLLFLGDSGAYLIGFLIAILSILLVNRNPHVSPWFPLLICIYPIWETIFTIWRRRIMQRRNPTIADRIHFHSLIFRRLNKLPKIYKSNKSYAKNSNSSHYLWLLTILGIIPATLWYQHTFVLQIFVFIFCITYSWVYKTLIKFNS